MYELLLHNKARTPRTRERTKEVLTEASNVAMFSCAPGVKKGEELLLDYPIVRAETVYGGMDGNSSHTEGSIAKRRKTT